MKTKTYSNLAAQTYIGMNIHKICQYYVKPTRNGYSSITKLKAHTHRILMNVDHTKHKGPMVCPSTYWSFVNTRFVNNARATNPRRFKHKASTSRSFD